MAKSLLPEKIESRIYVIRGQKVMLDRDLAVLYGVPTKSLNLAVKRNIGRFPGDFMFRLTKVEARSLRFQFETSKGRGGRRYLSYAFTEQGVAMLSSVLRSDPLGEMTRLDPGSPSGKEHGRRPMSFISRRACSDRPRG